jgi:hypothetical protein
MHVRLLFLLVALPASAQEPPSEIGTQPNPEALDQAVLHYVRPFTADMEATDWKARWADLNGDDSLDALVYLSGPDWCGSGGCTLLVFEAIPGPDAYELGPYRPAAEISLVTGPVLVAEAGLDGWRDLVMRNDGATLHVLRFDGETYPGSPQEGVAVMVLPEGDLLFAESNAPPIGR